ncbi:MAG: hypothetical protein ACRCZO_07230 [Cetobacterium sp.]|uniref:hypothetical protein n=1 Tax=unclassified Cetobacterium TaxID=2630983 RepID=UPI00064809F1|nr:MULTISPECIES: hypothetical protein [unclassified Cetobacterium]
MIIKLNKNDFKNLMEILEKHQIIQASTSNEVVQFEAFKIVYKLSLEEELVQIKSQSRDIDEFFNKIHQIAEIEDRMIPGEGKCSLKKIIEKELGINLSEVEECQ